MERAWNGSRLSLRDEWLDQLPEGVKEGLRSATGSEYLQLLAELALQPAWTLKVASRFEPLLVELCNRWLLNDDASGESDFRAFCAICRLVALHPNLAIYGSHIAFQRRRGIFQHLGSRANPECLTAVPDDILGSLLLALYRCLRHDSHTFSSLISGRQFQPLFKHDQAYIRYLAAKIQSVYLSAADAAFHALRAKHVPAGSAEGPWDHITIDYHYLDLWEQRSHSLHREYQADVNYSTTQISQHQSLEAKDLLSSTVVVGHSLQPTIFPDHGTQSSLVATPTTSRNLEKLGSAITKRKPVLITGLPGSGKSTLIQDVAHTYAKDKSMLTLHLNEQTDAKLLIGMYTSSGAPGSFKWQPGVLTTAVREGRWALIEDLDRAPAEVMSTLLSLMERRELFVPNLGGSITAHPDFRLFATIRSSRKGRSSQDEPPRLPFLGVRHWSQIHVEPLNRDDLRQIVLGKFPLLASWAGKLLEAYEILSNNSAAVEIEKQHATARSLSPRDLFKCCRRINQLLQDSGIKTSTAATSEVLLDHCFLEIVDCFVGFAQSAALRERVSTVAAQILQLSPQRREHCMAIRTPRHETTEKRIRLGRVTLNRRKQQQSGCLDARNDRPFAYTNDVLRKMEAIAAAVRSREPCLLVGETGTGKTTAVQELAKITGQKLIVVNLSQQSEAGDLLGGYKPLNLRSLATPLKDDFSDLFGITVSQDGSDKFMRAVDRAFAKNEYERLLKLWRQAVEKVKSGFPSPAADASTNPAKRRKVDKSKKELMRTRWDDFDQRLNVFEMHVKSGGKGFAFHFVEGNIVKAVRNGDWVLLDEINLATSDTLESLADLLTNDATKTPSLILTETGDVERVQAHPDFRIFAAMNPATDVGKRDLPLSLRSRFTEFYMTSPDRDPSSLLQIVEACLGAHIHQDPRAAQNTTNLYLDIVKLEESNQLVDGANQRPHHSLRTLTRTLAYVLEITPLYGLRRSLYEGFSMSFLTLLDHKSAGLVAVLIEKHILPKERERKSLLNRTPNTPADGRAYVRFEHYWLRKGPTEPQANPRYIITRFIRSNLLNLVRAASTRRFPVLLQGPTSSGKTSMVEYLAKISGNSFVRINNHEHTDLQEYLGTYVTDNEGNLRFQEGLLVQALRQGHWVVLDELNLAPTDILEALNRLLDDNRELFIPETQEVIRPHENFMLFATQNPAGLYGGRKALSRAFRNRFLELHFDDIPEDELEEILKQRTQVAPSHAKNIIQIYRKLAELRQSSRLFEQKGSFATLRDLFRWALRDITTREELAIHGYMLLAERVRNEEGREAVRKAIQDVTKVKVEPDILYANLSNSAVASNGFAQGIVWTSSMRRIYALVTEALKRNEPVLLVGGTGCGKTSVCQVIAEMAGTRLHIVNAHQNTETGDLVGAQRPIRNKSALEAELRAALVKVLQSVGRDLSVEETYDDLVAKFQSLDAKALEFLDSKLLRSVRDGITKQKALFEWSDGSLVQAMKEGTHFLLDEISLAEDSVLERLNSVLESSRTMLLAEKGPDDSFIIAADGFQFLATMNPGGDFGKRELSPALRNRFTEIWVPPMSSQQEIAQIAQAKLDERFQGLASRLTSFAFWFGQRFNPNGPALSIRDVLAWVNFLNTCKSLEPQAAVVEGAAMVYIDALGANPAAGIALASDVIKDAKLEALVQLSNLFEHDMTSIYFSSREIRIDPHFLRVGKFMLARQETAAPDATFSFQALTTITNMSRVVRALQLPKPVLLEGSPGVGKTTLVGALASAAGIPLTRINLSEQTDLMDLFGSDVPVEGSEAGEFAWRDAPFLQAMKRGEWVLLDEMNLASQSVLEGLNACLDHRGEVFIPELDQTFKRHSKFTIFAAQNPHSQGGGRKGLPASFVNRFTVVYADAFAPQDLVAICKERFSSLDAAIIGQVVDYVVRLGDMTQRSAVLSASGGPWEFNLRDILRWLELLVADHSPTAFVDPEYFARLLFLQRLRSNDAVALVNELNAKGHEDLLASRSIYRNLTPSTYQAGLALLPRDPVAARPGNVSAPQNISILESVMIGIMRQWPVLLVGSSGSGKTSIIRHIASMTGQELVELPLSVDMDTMDIVGGYEQADPHRLVGTLLSTFQKSLAAVLVQDTLPDNDEAWAFCGALQADEPTLEKIEIFLDSMTTTATAPIWSDLSSQFSAARRRMTEDLRARFEWTDGLLIQAMQTGKWLVLDNANLCSASVLDRLNSLLEPNGFLAINEHRRPDGSARVVRPHPNFKLFLTMDPRHGELSRAMRNRCLELYMPDSSRSMPQEDIEELVDSSLFRLQPVISSAISPVGAAVVDSLIDVAFDHFSLLDAPTLRSLPKQIENGLSPWLRAHSDSLERIFQRQFQYARGTIAFKTSIIEKYREGFTQLGANPDLAGNESLHPMNNSMLWSMVRQCHPNTLNSRVLATFFECWNYVQRLVYLLEVRHRQLEEGTVKPLSRLDRSLRADRVLTFSKEATAPLAGAVFDSLQGLATLLEGRSGSSIDMHALPILKQYAWFLGDLLAASSVPQFEDADFHAYLSIGRKLTRTSTSSADALNSLRHMLSNNLERFQAQGQLASGLGMSRLWLALRPLPMQTQAQKEMLYMLEDSMDRTSQAFIKSAIPHAALAQTRRQLIDVHQSVCVSPKSIDAAKEVLSSINDFVDGLSSDTDGYVPHFRDSFQAIVQVLELANDKLQISDALHLATCRPLKLSLDSKNQKNFSSALQGMQRGTGILLDQTPLQAVRSTAIPTLIDELGSMAKVRMGALDRLQNEFRELPRAVTELCKARAQDPFDALISQFASLHSGFQEVFKGLTGTDFGQQYTIEVRALMQKYNIREAHQDVAGEQGAWTGDEELERFRQVFEDHLAASINTLKASDNRRKDRLRGISKAWIGFFVGCLLLYIPDKAFDPALEPSIMVGRHRQRTAELETTIKALKLHGKATGLSESTPRIHAMQDEIAELGDEPPSSGALRPVLSRISQLSGDFTNILNSIVMRCASISLSDQDAIQTLGLLAQNTEQAVSRLDITYRDYDDIVKPAIQLLTGLRVGIELAKTSIFHEGSHVSLSKLDRVCLPVLQPSRSELLTIAMKDLRAKGRKQDSKLLYLQAIGLDAHVASALPLQYVHVAQQIFDDLYISWNEKLDSDRVDHAKKRSLYRYKDVSHDEDDDERQKTETKSLFPTYDESEADDESGGSSKTAANDPTELAKRLADVHAALFRGHSSSDHAFEQLVETSLERLAAFFRSKDISGICDIPAQGLLPTTILMLSNKATTLESPGKGKLLDFYRDANIGETRTIISLTKRIRVRFEHIHQAWPEQASPVDVLRVISELMVMPHTDPIAKILTKVEQLHGFVYQWEQVASREFSAATLYTELTDLIISWRRLELSSWSLLLDVEDKLCAEDAKLSWFPAYGMIVARSLSVIHEDESGAKLADYLVEVTRALMTSIENTPIGQYLGYLDMIRTFELHVRSLTHDLPILRRLCVSLTNVLNYYERFHALVSDRLKSNRQDLEKRLKEVVILASFKDKNIEALKASSRASHTKLFKIIRKYRALLAEPVQAIVLQDAPFDLENTRALIPSKTNGPPKLDLQQYGSLLECFSARSTIPPRFQSLENTLATMRRVGQIPSNSIDVASYLHAWVDELQQTSKELQKETPSTLTEENKPVIQQLKVRKRLVFAGVLKDLRIMGLKINVSAPVIESQTTENLLADSATIPYRTDEVYEKEFMRLVDNLASVNAAEKDHSDDLASEEVKRSMAYLRGFVDILVKQRCSLSADAVALERLQKGSAMLHNLSSIHLGGTLTTNDSLMPSKAQSQASATWLPIMIRFVAGLLNKHDQLGGDSTQSTQDSLESHAVAAAQVARELKSGDDLPDGLASINDMESRQKLVDLQTELQQSIDTWDTQCQQASFATAILRNWLAGDINSDSYLNGHPRTEQASIETAALQVLDKLLVSLQNASEVMKHLPVDEKDPGWLLKSTKALNESLESLSMSKISSLLRGQMERLASFGEGADLQNAAAVCSFMNPFVNAYTSICESLYDKSFVAHAATVRTTRVLSDSFRGLLSNGFCSPKDASKGERAGQDKLEEGTGLGEGEGAEDISKDIQDDEDLSDLAQGKKEEKEDNGEVEGEDNAVDMADQDLEGTMDEEGQEQDDEEDKEGDDDADDGPEEELGDVGNEDPEAVDEKLWDGNDKEESSENQNKADQKTGKQDDQMAADDENRNQPEQDENQDDVSGGEEDDQEGQDINDANLPEVDPHLQEEEKLDLPDDMNMDMDDKSLGSESDLEDMEDVGEDMKQGDEHDIDDDTKPDEVPVDDDAMDDQPAEEVQEGKDADEEAEPEDSDYESQNDALREQTDAPLDADDQLQGDTDGLAGSGEPEEQQQDQDQTQTGGTQGKSGAEDEAAGQEETIDEDQPTGSGAAGEGTSADDTLQDSAEAQAFKKLGNALEKFHRSSRDIRQAQTAEKEQEQANYSDQEAPEFEHLPDEEAETDQQALGNADEDQVRGLEDGAMDIDLPTNEAVEAEKMLLNGDEEKEEAAQDNVDADSMETDGPNVTTVGQRRKQEQPVTNSEAQQPENQDADEEIQDLDDELSEVHLQPPNDNSEANTDRSPKDALQLWQQCELRTNDLAMSLTEQLRLILAPTLATKMRGDFRTGKRLNIKRIIPYIASQYKRDKIWMRRSIPSKRNYQIMIAVDDSKSMDEPGSGSSQLAFETLALVSRSLSMLEAGQLCVVGFGQDVRVAHSFDQTFSSSAGASILQNFQFQQTKTDVRRLVSESLRLFREARAQNQGSNSELWQLELIISDGICEDHQAIQQLVRQAHQERVMIVFIIVDALKGTSISSLEQASFEKNPSTGEMELRMKRYLSEFPFDYYLIVGDVAELPAVLAAALRQWFSEIADT